MPKVDPEDASREFRPATEEKHTSHHGEISPPEPESLVDGFAEESIAPQRLGPPEVPPRQQPNRGTDRDSSRTCENSSADYPRWPEARKCVVAVSGDSNLLAMVRALAETDGLRSIAHERNSFDGSLLRDESVDLVVLDTDSSSPDDLLLVRLVQEIDDTLPVILAVDSGDLDWGVKGVEEGAYDFVRKPINARSFACLIRRGLEHVDLVRFKRDSERLLRAKKIGRAHV